VLLLLPLLLLLLPFAVASGRSRWLKAHRSWTS
jgi:hypothetical protein